MRLRKIASGPPKHPAWGFTLVELLVVILIILAVSAVALPTVIPALSHRQVSEAARLLQASLAGARDAAIHSRAPRGIRLLPDPVFLQRSTAGTPATNPIYGQIDPTSILAANRIIPIETAPDYSEGRLDFYNTGTPAKPVHTWTLVTGSPPPYPGGARGQGSAPYDWYPVPLPSPPYVGYPNYTSSLGKPVTPNVLCVVQSALDPTTLLPHSPTSWFWNIRLGDKISIDNSSTYYTVVGPITVYPGNPNTNFEGNPELFVNDGPPGSTPGLTRTYYNGTGAVVAEPAVEYLFLVNGVDDDGNGFIDDGWDNIDNNRVFGTDDLDEWENEKWFRAHPAGLNASLPYTIRRRPVPSSNTKEVPLPSNIVIDLTTWSTTKERSRLPVDRYTGNVDILLNPTGDVVPTTLYSSPSSFGLAGSFFHFWLAERGDVAAPVPWDNQHPNLVGLFHLPMLAGTGNSAGGATYDQLRAQYVDLGELKGERQLVSLNTRTGQVTTNAVEAFDVANVNLPFIAPQQGAQGGP